MKSLLLLQLTPAALGAPLLFNVGIDANGDFARGNIWRPRRLPLVESLKPPAERSMRQRLVLPSLIQSRNKRQREEYRSSPKAEDQL
ncbi:MAG: hypothetical protein SGCHY_001608 [Lobulomycetales sp.]